MTREEMEKEVEKLYRDIASSEHAKTNMAEILFELARGREVNAKDLGRVLTWIRASILTMKRDIEHLRQTLKKEAVKKGDVG